MAPQIIGVVGAGTMGGGIAETGDRPRPCIFAMIVNEAAFALAEDVASAADIDTALRLGANYPRGPLALADEIGLGLLLAVMEGLQHESGEDRYRPAPLLRQLVAAGRGFHEGSGTGQDA